MATPILIPSGSHTSVPSNLAAEWSSKHSCVKSRHLLRLSSGMTCVITVAVFSIYDPEVF